MTKTEARRERLVTLPEVAEHLGKPTSWVYNNAERVGMPRYRLGNQWRFRLSEVDEWVEQATVNR